MSITARLVKRRTVIATACIACKPLALRAQPSPKLHRIGWLDYSSSADNLGIFVQAMKTRGWVDGKTFRIEYRGAEGSLEKLSAVASELTRLPVDVIVAPGASEALAAKQASTSVPVVITGVDDPVERGLIQSLARPGGNITGLATAGKELRGKMLSLLREFYPRATSAAVLWDGSDAEHRLGLKHFEAAANTLKLTLQSVEVRRHTEVEPAFAAIKKQAGQLLVVQASSMLVPRWVADLALKHRVPLASISPDYAYEGGLMAYSDDWNAVFDGAARFVDRILKAAKPADLPVELPTRFKLIVNAKTAQALGVTIPATIRIRADSIVE